MENGIETELVHNFEQKKDTGQNTDSDQKACRCCYILLKTHFLQCSKQQRRKRRCKTCDVECRNKRELRAHRREKHPQEWKQERLQKIPKVLLEGVEDGDDYDDDHDIGILNNNTEPELNLEKTAEPSVDENSFMNQLTGNQEYLNGTGTSEVPGHESTLTSEEVDLVNLIMNQEAVEVTEEAPRLSMSQIIVPQEDEESVYECDICSSFFGNYDVYMKHVEKHREDETLKEEHEEDVDTTGDDDWMGNQQEEEKTEYDCERCGKTFNQEYLYDNHVLTCGNKELECHECGKRFKNKLGLLTHVRKTHVNHDCPYCGKKCAHKSRLKDHLRVHTKERAHQCEKCNKYFARRHNVERHKLICTEGKPVHCGECGASYSQRSTVIQHLRSHRAEPRQCAACGEWFRSV